MENKYYVYRHVRLDKNEVFYIGRGTKHRFSTYKGQYKRAYSKDGRSKFWKRIIEKNNNIFQVDIIFESNDFDEILEKEKEFIKLYGRRNLGLGTLVNLDDGGIGSTNQIATALSRERKSKNNYAKIHSYGAKNPKSKPLYLYDMKGNFIGIGESVKHTARTYNLRESSICAVIKGINTHANFHRIFREYKGEKIEELKVYKQQLTAKSVVKFDKYGKIIEEFASMKQAAEKYSKHPSAIYRAIKLNSFSCGGYWNYKSKENVRQS